MISYYFMGAIILLNRPHWNSLSQETLFNFLLDFYTSADTRHKLNTIIIIYYYKKVVHNTVAEWGCILIIIFLITSRVTLL